MSRSPRNEPWRNPELGPCACSQLRRAARAVTAFYDEYLAKAGLTITQYAVLVHIGRAESIQRTLLATKLGMDRTTLTRNLSPLEREGLVVTTAGDDRRERKLSLTPLGRKTLDKGYQHWVDAQTAFLRSLGSEHLDAMRQSVSAAEQAARAHVHPRALGA